MLRILLGNRVIQLLGLIISALTLIATIAFNEIRTFIGLDKDREERTSETEPSPLVEDLNASYPSFNYTIHEHQTQYVKDAQTNLSVTFQNLDGEYFVSLTISAIGKKSSVHAVLNGYTEEFQSTTGIFYIQVLNIDYAGKKIMVQISRKS